MTLARGRQLGIDISGQPLFEIRARPWQAPDLEAVDGLLIGSGNAIREGGAPLRRFHRKPVYAVGATTAAEARLAGFSVARAGTGGLQALIDTIALETSGEKPLRLLRLAGADNVPLYPAENITIEERVVYEQAALPMSPDLEGSLRKGGVVLLHSAASTRHLEQECQRLSIPTEALALAALGPRIAAAATCKWAEIRHAPSPNDAALLALAKDMCQESRKDSPGKG